MSGLLERWVGGWQYIKDRAGAAYYELTFQEGDFETWTVRRPHERMLGTLALRVELFAERMEVLAHVLNQRTPVDANSHRHKLEEVGRALYTAKAVVALVLDRRQDVDDENYDPVCVAVFNVQPCGGEASDRDERWEEVVVPEGFSGWTYELRSESSY